MFSIDNIDKATVAIVLNMITLAIVVYMLVSGCHTKETFESGQPGALDVPEGKQIMITDQNGNMDTFDVSKLQNALSTLKSDLERQINTKADSGHNHDGRYYTETEANTRYYTKTQADNRYHTKTSADTRYMRPNTPFKIYGTGTDKDGRDNSNRFLSSGGCDDVLGGDHDGTAWCKDGGERIPVKVKFVRV